MATKKQNKEPTPSSELIKMVREDGKEADVHPVEAENFKAGGYKVKEGA